MSDEELSLLLTRWGQSISYHDLEIALGEDLKEITVCDGVSSFLSKIRPETKENGILKGYFEYRSIDLPKGYANYYLDLILQKKKDRVTRF